MSGHLPRVENGTRNDLGVFAKSAKSGYLGEYHFKVMDTREVESWRRPPVGVIYWSPSGYGRESVKIV